MTTAVLRRQVTAAIGRAWPTFVREHPTLAQVVDEELLSNYVFDTLADDDAFVAAYRNACKTATRPAALATIVDAFVKPVLKRIL